MRQQPGAHRQAPLYGAGRSAAAGRRVRKGALQKWRAADPVSGGVRQPARNVRPALCGRTQREKESGGSQAGEYPAAGQLSGSQPDGKAYYRGLSSAGRYGRSAGSGAVCGGGTFGRCSGRGLLYVPRQGLCQYDRRPAGG